MDHFEFEASLVCKGSFRTVTQTNTVTINK